MNKRRKALSVALATALLIPVLTTTAFGGALGYNDILYEGYIKGNTTLGGNLTLTDPAARDLYNDLIFTSGAPGSASGSGYGSFYTGVRATGAYAIINGVDDTITGGTGETHTLDELRPIGNIKWVLHDGVLVITNDWTDAEVEAKMNRNVDETMQFNARKSMTQMNFLNFEHSQLEITPFRNNPNIETVIIGDNIDYNAVRALFVGCDNLRNIICLDSGFNKIIEDSDLDYAIVCAGETSGEFYGKTSSASVPATADKIAYLSSNDRLDFTKYTPASKGSVSIGMPTFTFRPNTLIKDVEVWPDASTVASQYAQAKQYVSQMNLPDWALAYLPVEMGGTETARTVGDVFNFESATLKSNWNDGSNQTVTETPVTEPETPVVDTDATSVTYSNWAAEDIITAISMGYLDDDPDVFGYQPAVTDLLGSDYTRAITRGQFAALAVRYYETLMSDITGEDYTIPVNSGDNVFADCSNNENMAKAYNLGILGGYNSAPNRSGVYVGPNDLITREQAATMLTRLMEKLIVAFDSVGRTGWTVWYADSLPFTDTISDWALDGVRAVYGVGAMTGTTSTTFSPKSNYTIEQSIVTLMRIDNNWARAGMG
ncbi:S-layer homology domain-containing protein [Intestinimonas butyriciproducens]|uniref:S-layer homology domain-containing protein n=1 Tax=Intestinimonas butyriciproducens TaxID=1297617 RepID=UPI001957716D|nr:S-layer homology domain-containing protein [Intestinimonas butyriciproducens]MBM6977528.1 hypothetical protein [Intestinimonas butyriciproducens]